MFRYNYIANIKGFLIKVLVSEDLYKKIYPRVVSPTNTFTHIVLDPFYFSFRNLDFVFKSFDV